MIECSACGKQLGHLYASYINMSKQLIRDTSSVDGNYDALIDLIKENTDKYNYVGGNITEFLTIYYTWAKDHPSHDLFQPSNLVARALLAINDLTPDQLPFGYQGLDGQRNPYDARTCCMTSFQCTPVSNATF
jgi:hypothetical protein